MNHILERAVIHFFSATALVMLAFFVLRTIRRHWAKKWLPDNWQALLTTAAVTVFAFSTMREAYDVFSGQALSKAFTDYLSWLLGCGIGAWGLYRFKVDNV